MAWQAKQDDSRSLAARQRRIGRNAQRLSSVGAHALYSSCATLRAHRLNSNRRAANSRRNAAQTFWASAGQLLGRSLVAAALALATAAADGVSAANRVHRCAFTALLPPHSHPLCPVPLPGTIHCCAASAA